MRPGTPNFVGARLRDAREMRRMSAAQLAELIDVSRQAVANYESGAQTPSPETLRRLCDVLRLPMHRFTLPRPPIEAGTTFWRCQMAATKAERLRSKQRTDDLAGLCSIIEKSVELPRVNFPRFDDLPAEPEKLTADAIEDAADRTRRHWGLGLGPISNVVWLLENNGAVVVRQFLDAPKLDAFSRWMRTTGTARPIVVLGTDKASAVRSRFDAAHELGHLILHRRQREEDLVGARYELIETQAHAFARAFLMPEQTFASEFRVPSLEAFRALKIRWRVSIQSMIERVYHLKLISDEQRTNLWRNLTRRGWRRSEPMDDMLEPEEPRLVARALDLLLSQGIASKGSLEMLTGLYAWEIAEVAGVPETFFLRDHSPLRLIPREQSAVDEAWQRQGDRSLTFSLHQQHRDVKEG